MNNINNLVFYIKFIDRNYLDDFINKGEIHFNPIKYYRKRGKSDSTIGDIEEGTKNYKFSYGDTIIFDKKFKHKLLSKEEVNIRININDNAYICCLTYIQGKDLYEISNGHYKIKESVINGLQKNFPIDTYAPILLNRFISFKNQLFDKFKAPTFSNFITYYAKSKKDLAFKKVSSEFKHKITEKIYNNIQVQNTFYAFIKNKKYKDQKEVRLLAMDGSDLDENNNIYMGNISNYIHNISNLKECEITKS